MKNWKECVADEALRWILALYKMGVSCKIATVENWSNVGVVSADDGYFRGYINIKAESLCGVIIRWSKSRILQ